MTRDNEELKERIKELTCLYEISSIISNTNYKEIDDTLQAIAICLKKGFQFPGRIEIEIDTLNLYVKTGPLTSTNKIAVSIRIFNEANGQVSAFLIDSDEEFLIEEKALLDNVAIKIGNILERIALKKNEEVLNSRIERADRLNILGELTAGIAHELNTPLANILGFAELLEEKMTDANAKADIQKIINNAIFSREVVKNLMFFACEIPQEMKKVNIVPIINNAINLLQPSFKKKNLRYIAKIEQEELLLRADSIQLTQIIFNLLINAIYFTPEKGLITIKASQTEKEMKIIIKDEGRGFTKDTIGKIFQPFFTTKPTGEGSGMGLSVVHGIVKSHKGTIVAKNNLKKGAVFIIKIPKL
ncbi:HAMP domain-containing histidine kinase [Bizionia saleffrena]|uniref:histidine kinase n=1 Tax=Bizionia saleffrena TaxID=291189 RepID=A0A8H2QKR4_9FLAO|nr:HAMP domain-containing sensor histidine kinase [Bizionia saleffrena]TYB80375.1 HAMP domain-containing histidine kinase [Bizionia saleffrena]